MNHLVTRAVTSTAAVVMHVLYLANPSTQAFQFAVLGYLGAVWVIVGTDRKS